MRRLAGSPRPLTPYATTPCSLLTVYQILSAPSRMYSVLLGVALITCLGLSECASFSTSGHNVQKPLGESNVPDEEDVLAA